MEENEKKKEEKGKEGKGVKEKITLLELPAVYLWAQKSENHLATLR